MASRQKYTAHAPIDTGSIPFDSAEEAWFWFIRAQKAKSEGARFSAGQGVIPRPCEPVDILRVLDRLYRNRRLQRDHLLVLRHYGRRDLAPDPSREREAQAFGLWEEALERMESILKRKGIVHKNNWQPNQGWHKEAFIFQGGTA